MGLKNVVITNGSVSLEVLDEVLPWLDAFNIDLKGFTDNFTEWCMGNWRDVKRFIVRAAGKSHVEITTLIIPGA